MNSLDFARHFRPVRQGVWGSLCVWFLTVASGISLAQVEIDPADIAPQGAPVPEEQPKPAARQPVDDNDVNFDPFRLGVVKHRTLQIRPEEADVYYQLLEHARKTNYVDQQQQALKNVARREKEFRRDPANARKAFSLFADVLYHPELYPAELMTFKGNARKAFRQPPDPDRPGVEPPYEIWMYPDDSQSNPAVILCSQVPPGMPLGGNILERLEVTGYFFKIYGYHAQDNKLRVAPLLVAQKVDWFPRPDLTPKHNDWVTAGILITFLVAVMGGLLWKLAVRHKEKSAEAERPEQIALPDIPDPSV